MKVKVTRTMVYAQIGKENIFYLGYCEMQSILNVMNPFAYTCGVYGWNADLYQIGDFVICTGYRPFGTNFPIPYEQRKTLEQRFLEDVKSVPWNERRHFAERFLEDALRNAPRTND